MVKINVNGSFIFLNWNPVLYYSTGKDYPNQSAVFTWTWCYPEFLSKKELWFKRVNLSKQKQKNEKWRSYEILKWFVNSNLPSTNLSFSA